MQQAALGATGACTLDAASVFVKDWIRLKCEVGCDGHGRPSSIRTCLTRELD
ncbi:MAG: hypothetical protein JW839_07315 [Candidatus Lokiarchaeota archaeon]|nr:hypothetical protein [Candidatus Lokiarchaeota archaeon]